MTQEELLGGGTRLEFQDANSNPVQTTTRISQITNGQTVQVTETVNHLAKGTEIASSKELVTSGGAKIVNSTTADGHIQEDTYATVNGKQTLQSSKIISYSQTERDTAALDVSLAGLELIQALRSGNKVQAAGSLIRLVNNAEIASNQMPTLGAIGTGFSGAVSLISALDSWGNASDGERIALAARAVLGANEVAKAFSANGQTGFLDAGKGVNALNVAGGIVALASLESTLESGNPFAIASSVMSIANAGAALMSQAAVFGPQAMIAVAIASIVFGSLFGGDIEYPDPPPAGTLEIGRLADGSLGMLFKDADGKLFQTRDLSGKITWQETQTVSADLGHWVSYDLGDSQQSRWVSDIQYWQEPLNQVRSNQNFGLGADVLSQRMTTLIGELQAQANKDGTHLVLDRLPILSVHGYPSFDRNGVDNFFFALRFNDPGTGAQQLMAAANQDVAKQYKEIAAYAGAVVGKTEWAQIQAKKAAGDALATETEGQYVDRHSGANDAQWLCAA